MLNHCTNPSEAFHHFSQGNLINYTKKNMKLTRPSTVLPKSSSLTSFLFEKQGTSEGSE